jgi:hypothetical protein
LDATDEELLITWLTIGLVPKTLDIDEIHSFCNKVPVKDPDTAIFDCDFYLFREMIESANFQRLLAVYLNDNKAVKIPKLRYLIYRFSIFNCMGEKWYTAVCDNKGITKDECNRKAKGIRIWF